MKMLGTFVLVPAGVWFNFHAFMDITLTGEWDPFGGEAIHVSLAHGHAVARSLRHTSCAMLIPIAFGVQYIILVLLPCLSHLGCLYIIISFWMDEVRHPV
jgi:hypothetical protein